jgi:hypothetical protein
MPKWVWVVLVVIGFLVVGGIVERRRITAMENWCRAHGYSWIDLFEPAKYPPIALLAARASGQDVGHLRWASAVTVGSGDRKVILAEFCYTPARRKNVAWFTLVVWAAGEEEGRGVVLDGYRAATSEGVLTPSHAELLLSRVGEGGSEW